MKKEDRDKVFKENGFSERENEVCMGVSVWLPSASRREGIFLIAKNMGTWNYFTVVSAESSKLALKNESRGIEFKIETEEQLGIILKSLS